MIHTVCKVILHCKSRHTQPSWKWIKSTLWTRGQELTRDCLILFLLFSVCVLCILFIYCIVVTVFVQYLPGSVVHHSRRGVCSWSFSITIKINTKTGISLWLFTKLIVVLSSNSFFYWWTRWVYWEVIVPGSVREQQKLSWSEPSLHATFFANSNSHFQFPFLFSISIPFPVSWLSTCPSCSIISPIFLTCEVLPGNYISLWHCQHLSRKANLVLLAPTQLSAARLVW